MDAELFTRDLVSIIGDMAMTKCAGSIPSSQLLQAMRFVPIDSAHGQIYIPHYWAIYVHDGRGPFGPTKGTYLCWFRNPADDPRLDAGRQVERHANVRHLTPEQWLYWLKMNRVARALGNDPPMIVTRYVSKSTPPTNFFLNTGGMAGLREQVQAEINPLVQEYFHDLLDAEGLLNIKDQLTFAIN
jgi:hypothetical protein